MKLDCRKPLLVVVTIVAASVGTASPASAIVPTNGANYTTNTTLDPGTYSLPAGISLGQNGITLDCQGATLLGNFNAGSGAATFGISVLGRSGVTIRNCNVRGYFYAVRAESSNGVHILDNDFAGNWGTNTETSVNIQTPSTYAPMTPTIRLNLGGGIYLKGLSNATVEHNVLSGQNVGISLYAVSGSTVQQNDASHNFVWGIHLHASSNNLIEANIADHVDRGTNPAGHHETAGLLVVNGSNANQIIGNSLRFGGDGLFLGNEAGNPNNDNEVRGNDGSYSPHNAFEATFSSGNRFIDNDASYSAYGFWAGVSHTGTVFEGNRVVGNLHDGIAIEHGGGPDGGPGITLERNVVIGNGGHGINLWWVGPNRFLSLAWLPDYPLRRSRYYTIRRNVIMSNIGHGLWMDDNTTDSTVSDNVFRLNGSDASKNARGLGAANNWSLGPIAGPNVMNGASIGGNFWEGYGGVDSNADGLGDTNVPFLNSGVITPGDFHPIVAAINAGSCAPLGCGGDCNLDGSASVPELVTEVSIALGQAALSSCTAGDVDGDGFLRIHELILATRHALDGSCGSARAVRCTGNPAQAGCQCSSVVPG